MCARACKAASMRLHVYGCRNACVCTACEIVCMCMDDVPVQACEAWSVHVPAFLGTRISVCKACQNVGHVNNVRVQACEAVRVCVRTSFCIRGVLRFGCLSVCQACYYIFIRLCMRRTRICWNLYACLCLRNACICIHSVYAASKI